jgi:hypothetical protein
MIKGFVSMRLEVLHLGLTGLLLPAETSGSFGSLLSSMNLVKRLGSAPLLAVATKHLTPPKQVRRHKMMLPAEMIVILMKQSVRQQGATIVSDLPTFLVPVKTRLLRPALQMEISGP